MFLSPEPLPVISAHEIATKPLPPVDWVVRPLIAASERTILYGEFGSLKSWALLHLGLSVAAGRDWLGAFSVPKPRGVLYVDEEMSEYTLRSRTKRLLNGMKLKATEDMPFWMVSRLGVRMTEIGAQVLLDRIGRAKIEPSVIIIEALRRVLIGSENEATDISAFWRSVEPIVKAGKCLIVSHHMRKPHGEFEEDPRHRASGSTDILAGPDTGWALTRHPGTPSCTMTCTKIRLAEEPKPFTLEFDFGATQDSPVTAYVAPQREKADSQGGKAILTILEHLAGSQTASTADLLAVCEPLGIGRTTTFRALEALIEQRRIHKVAQGMWALGPDPEMAGI